MTTFSRAWTDAYLGLPANTEDARKGASRIRDLKADIEERMLVDHSWAGDTKDGAHLKVTLYPRDTDPATIEAGTVYAKIVGTGVGADIELFYKSKNGVITQLTNTGAASGGSTFTGSIILVGRQDNMAPSYLDCDGSPYSRTTYATLFNTIGTTWGAGDGVNTFNVPDMRGRVPVGMGTGTGLTNRAIAVKFGEETHVLTQAEIPDHGHPLGAQTGSVGAGEVAYQGASAQNHIGGVGPNAALQGLAHNNMQPSIGMRYVIKT